MRVHSVCGYRSRDENWVERWTDADYRARNLVKAVKGEAFGGFSEWTVRATKQKLRIDATEAGQAVALRVATSKLLDLFAAAGIDRGTLIPVPSSQTVAAGGNFTGARLARAIAGLLPNVVASPTLYFAHPQPRAHNGGARRWQDLLPHLCGIAPAAASGPVILIDDVMTTGGHLRACGRYLAARGFGVDDAFVIGRTVWARPDDMFTMPVETLEL